MTIVLQTGKRIAFLKFFFIDPHYESTFLNSFGNVKVDGRDVVVDETAYIGTNRDISFLDDPLTAGGQVVIRGGGVVDVVVVVIVSSLIVRGGVGFGGSEMTPTARTIGRRTTNN